jgi:uncharacterized membrane protein YphA (DoxX/SURF4 family)
MVELVPKRLVEQGWWVRHAESLKSVFRVIFGAIWIIDGSLKFAPGLVGQFAGMVRDAGAGQPAWLGPWFSFWSVQAAANPAFWVYSTGVAELAVGLALLFGFMRKIAYAGGVLLSLLIWAVPEGFGGPYGPGSTDIGTGIVYAILFLTLIILNAAHGPSRLSLDYHIEKRWPRWAAVAEFQRLVPPEDLEPTPASPPPSGA